MCGYTAKHVPHPHPFLYEGVWSAIFHLDKFVRLEHQDLAVKLLLMSNGVKQAKRYPSEIQYVNLGDCFEKTCVYIILQGWLGSSV